MRNPLACASSYDVEYTMNSSSVPTMACQPRSASRSTWAFRICLGEATTGAPSCQPRSASTSAVFSYQGILRRVSMSGVSTKSPYPRSHDDMANPPTVFISTSTASR